MKSIPALRIAFRADIQLHLSEVAKKFYDSIIVKQSESESGL